MVHHPILLDIQSHLWMFTIFTERFLYTLASPSGTTMVDIVCLYMFMLYGKLTVKTSFQNIHQLFFICFKWYANLIKLSCKYNLWSILDIKVILCIVFFVLSTCHFVLYLCIVEKKMLKLTFHSLTYNEFTSWGYCMDTALEPLFWFVDHFVKYLGPVGYGLDLIQFCNDIIHVLYASIYKNGTNSLFFLVHLTHCFKSYSTVQSG